MAQISIKTPLGTAFIEGDKNGISKISVSDNELVVSEAVPPELEQAVFQLKEYFSGNLKAFQLELNPEGTEFQQKVWRELTQIPFGKTLSYLELSRKLDDVKAIRAV
ncbi:MAG TPA: MGMT family protein, partial [Salinimicrobium sp.]|nr:MGMT family protein [Salinimicrobium sp.]